MAEQVDLASDEELPIENIKRSTRFHNTLWRSRKNASLVEISQIVSASAEGVVYEDKRISIDPDNKEEKDQDCTEDVISTAEYFASLNDFENISVKLIQGDITKIKAEAIIVPGNDRLYPLGGVAKAVFKAAGSELGDEIQKKIRGEALKVGDCLFTSSGALKENISQIVHLVTPKWKPIEYRTGTIECLYSLCSALFECFQKCADKSITTIALPAIGTGYGGIPEKLCCIMYLMALIELDDYCSGKDGLELKIYFVDINTAILTCFSEECNLAFNRGLESLEDVIDEETDKLFGIKAHKISQTILIKVYRGRISSFIGGNIICAVNSNLVPSGEESKTIFHKAGEDIQEELESHRKAGKLKTSDVIVTGARNLFCDQVFHCVIPKKKRSPFSGKHTYKANLTKCYSNAFLMASEMDSSVLALYVLGADTGYMEMDMCCSALVDALHYLTESSYKKSSLSTLHIICRDDTTLDCLRNHMKNFLK